jgi:hypothetical protein
MISGRKRAALFALSPDTALAKSKPVWDALADQQLETICQLTDPAPRQE